MIRKVLIPAGSEKKTKGREPVFADFLKADDGLLLNFSLEQINDALQSLTGVDSVRSASREALNIAKGGR